MTTTNLTTEQLDRLEDTAEMMSQNGRAYTPSTETLLSLITMARRALIYEAALKKYANKSSWHKPIAGNSAVVTDIQDTYRDEGDEWPTGGKLAREALAAGDRVGGE